MEQFDNMVIKVLNKEHGKRVIKFFKSKGVDTGDFKGDSTLFPYYGLKNGGFDNYSDNYVVKRNLKIIELPETDKIEKEMKKRVIKSEEAQSIINIACGVWKRKLAGLWSTKIVLGEDIEIEEEFYLEMRNACTSVQHILFDTIFGPDTNEIDLSNPLTFGKLAFFDEKGFDSTVLLSLRLGGAFKNKSFYLNHRFNWEIKVDDFGKNCLIPTKK